MEIISPLAEFDDSIGAVTVAVSISFISVEQVSNNTNVAVTARKHNLHFD